MDSALILEFSRRVKENIQDFEATIADLEVPFEEAVEMTREEFQVQSISFVYIVYCRTTCTFRSGS